MSLIATPSGKWDHSGSQIPVVMVRLNLKLLLVIFILSIGLVTVSLWSRCGDIAAVRSLVTDKGRGGPVAAASSDVQGYEEIDCSINGEYSVGCRKEGGEIYVPFSFVRKYFDVYGKMATYDGYERFEWSHSYSKVYYPKGRYDPRGVYMYFENYNVEVRERVKCVSGVAGVPISTQWSSQGYFYPTQIAQFGLSHYSKNLTEPEPRRRMLEDGDKETARWVVPNGGSLVRTFDAEAESHVLAFNSPETLTTGITLKLDHVLDFVLSVNVRFEGNASFTVALQSREKRETFFLHYIASDLLVSAQESHTYHGIGTEPGYRRITRDLVVDLQKGLLFQNRKRKLSRSKLKVVAVTFRGRGRLDNLTLSSSEHLALFYDAAEWFVRRLDPTTGGWPNPVRRHVTRGMQDLSPGWYSAMGQGHAISVLARAYHHSNGETRYLDAALAGLKPFTIGSEAGGVRATFADKHVWYEEYPTRPPSFVLNGFVFALLGLYDLASIAPPDRAETAQALFDAGMASLKKMLMLYDTGSGTVYDLRHFTLGTAPNLARWDYHATHVNQLLLLATIDPDPLLSATAERWIGYMSGKRAPHN